MKLKRMETKSMKVTKKHETRKKQEKNNSCPEWFISSNTIETKKSRSYTRIHVQSG
jgi:hypothetical protein